MRAKPGNNATKTTTTKTRRRRRRSLQQYGFHNGVNDRASRERRNQVVPAAPPPPPPAPAPAAAAPPEPWTQRLSIEIAPNSAAQARRVRDVLLGGRLVAAGEGNGTAVDSPLVAALSDAGWDEVDDAVIASVDGKEVAKGAAAAAGSSSFSSTKSLSGGAVAGIVIVVLLLALALAALGAFLVSRRRHLGGGGAATGAGDPESNEKRGSWFPSVGGAGAAVAGQNGDAAAALTKLASSRSADLEVAAAKAAALAAPSSRHSSSTTTELYSHKLDIEAAPAGAASPAVDEKGRRFRKLFGGGGGVTAAAASTTAPSKELSTPLPPPPLQPNYEPAEPGLGTDHVVAGARRDLTSIAAAGVSSLRKLAAAAGGGGGGGGEKAAAAGGGAAAAAAIAAAASPQKRQQPAPLEQQQQSKPDDPISQAETAIAALAARGTPYTGKYSLSRSGPTAKTPSSKSKSKPTIIIYRATELAPPGRAATATFYLSDEQFRHEASMAARLPPGDVTHDVLDAYAAGDAPGARMLPACVVAEAADYSLEEWPERRARAPDAVQRRAVLALVAKAVAGAHARGVVHGSLCPSAVLWFSGANVMRLGELSRWAPAGGRAPLHAEPR